MRIFLAGATGVIGVRLVPMLLDAGHVVAGMTRSQPQVVKRLGAQPVVCDVYDLPALRDAVGRFAPDLVVHQLTDLPDDEAELEAGRAATQRIRTEGTRNLRTAADGAPMLAQSVAFPAAVADHERLILDAGGVILRYGRFYGPGTWAEGDRLPPPPRIHVQEAATRTMDALDTPPGTIVEIVEH